MFWDLIFVIYLELGTCDLEIVWKMEIENWKLNYPFKQKPQTNSVAFVIGNLK
jgi:hypothetical protein